MKVNLRFACVLLVLAFPLAAWSQSTMNFPLPVDSANGSLVGYAVVNPTRTPAVVTFTVYEDLGRQATSASISVPAGAQVAKLFSELFRNSDVAGWVQATSTVSGLQGFTMGGDFVNQVDGSASPVVAADQVFPLMADNTALVVANPSGVPLNLTISFYTASGFEINPAISVGISGHGLLVQRLLDLPSYGSEYADARYLRVTGSGGFAATAMVAQYLIAKPEFALYNGTDVSNAGNVLNFPHVVSGELDGVEYRTAIALTNLTTTEQTVTLTFTPESGFGAISIQLTMFPSASIREVIQFPGGGFRNGWLQVQSGGPIAGVLSVVNANPRAAGIAVVQPQNSGSTSMIFSHIANLAPWSTGLAFVNTSFNPATVEVFAVKADGTSLGSSARFTLEPGAKATKLLSELVPLAQGSNGGFVFAGKIMFR